MCTSCIVLESDTLYKAKDLTLKAKDLTIMSKAKDLSLVVKANDMKHKANWPKPVPFRIHQ